MGFVRGGVAVDVMLCRIRERDAEVVDCGLRVDLEVLVDADGVLQFDRW